MKTQLVFIVGALTSSLNTCSTIPDPFIFSISFILISFYWHIISFDKYFLQLTFETKLQLSAIFDQSSSLALQNCPSLMALVTINSLGLEFQKKTVIESLADGKTQSFKKDFSVLHQHSRSRSVSQLCHTTDFTV